MSLTHFAEEPNQEQRIAKLREEIKKLGGSAMSLEDLPADVEEEFSSDENVRKIVAFIREGGDRAICTPRRGSGSNGAV